MLETSNLVFGATPNKGVKKLRLIVSSCCFYKVSMWLDDYDVKLDGIEHKNLNDRTLITSSAWRTSNNAASGGVGLL